jgi:hypothetical protein
MSYKLFQDPYISINLILAGIITVVFLYSGLFSAEKSNHPIPSNSKLINIDSPASKGMSRAFSEIIRFNFEQARVYNPYSLKVFSFFTLQLFIRIGLIPLIFRINQRSKLITTDIVISAVLFLYAFSDLIGAMYQVQT